MSTTYTAEELITSIRNLGMVPDTGELGGEDADILRHINEELILAIIPELISTRENFLVVTERQALTSGVLKYRLPARAIGDGLRWVKYVSSDSGKHTLDFIPESHHAEYSWESTDVPQGYYLEGNYLCLIGSSFSGWVEWSYHFRPGELVLSTECRQIISVDAGTKTIVTASNLPTTWSNTQKYDIHSGKSGSEIKVWSAAATSVGGTGLEDTMTFTAEIDGSVSGTHPVEVGDWVCLEEEAAVPAIPRDLQPLLVRALAYRMAEAGGDVEKVRVHHDLFTEAAKKVVPMLTPRAGVSYRLRGCKGRLWKQK